MKLSAAAAEIQKKSGIPPIGLGTSGRTGDEGMQAILEAIEIGYRHIDTAQTYGSEVPIRGAVQRSGLARSDFFITTKVSDVNFANDRFRPSVEQSLENLGIDQVDLLLLHWPAPNPVDSARFEDYMLSLVDAKRTGLARMIGVSNFSIAGMEHARDVVGNDVLITNQVELNPYSQSPNLTAYASRIGLTLTAFRPLAQGKASEDPVLKEIAVRLETTASVVALAYLIANGHVAVPGSTNPERLRDHLTASRIEMSSEDVLRIAALDRNLRSISPAKAPRWDD